MKALHTAKTTTTTGGGEQQEQEQAGAKKSLGMGKILCTFFLHSLAKRK
jgi:hypothetical protein